MALGDPKPFQLFLARAVAHPGGLRAVLGAHSPHQPDQALDSGGGQGSHLLLVLLFHLLKIWSVCERRSLTRVNERAGCDAPSQGNGPVHQVRKTR
uniref:Uncharacterized protein n=1 Tax=Cereibacter sphaeroides (strain ATCC 17025 / ATH 2.4.3) TaxID=349102 RepID=A4WV56_CERS5